MFSDKDNEGNGKINKMDTSKFVCFKEKILLT
jgi:hypothetical protein